MIGGMTPTGGPPDRPEWRLLQQAVGRVVDAQDPEGLLAAGAPADEYGAEIQALVGLILRGPVTVAEVVGIWEHWFGPDSALTESPDSAERLTGELVAIRQRRLSGHMAESLPDADGGTPTAPKSELGTARPEHEDRRDRAGRPQ